MGPEVASAATQSIRLEGVFDGLAARGVEVQLERAEAGARFLIDLTKIREFHDFGIAVLGRALARSKAHVTLRGLRQHQIRVLRYFGVETEPLERAIMPDAG